MKVQSNLNCFVQTFAEKTAKCNKITLLSAVSILFLAGYLLKKTLFKPHRFTLSKQSCTTKSIGKMFTCHLSEYRKAKKISNDTPLRAPGKGEFISDRIWLPEGYPKIAIDLAGIALLGATKEMKEEEFFVANSLEAFNAKLKELNKQSVFHCAFVVTYVTGQEHKAPFLVEKKDNQLRIAILDPQNVREFEGGGGRTY